MGVEENMDLYKLYNQVQSADVPTTDSAHPASGFRIVDGFYSNPQFVSSFGDDFQQFLDRFLKSRAVDQLRPSWDFRRPVDDVADDDVGNDSVDLNRVVSSLVRNQSSVSGSSGSIRNVATLADQFTWGAVVCAAVFIVVFVCVMTAWWVHKRQQDSSRSQGPANGEDAEANDGVGPICIDNTVRTISSNRLNSPQIQCPPSYYDVIGFFDPPPSYNEVLTRINISGTHAYDNQITVDEVPPPNHDAEVQKCLGAAATAESSANPNVTLCAVIVLPNSSGDGHTNSSTQA